MDIRILSRRDEAFRIRAVALEYCDRQGRRVSRIWDGERLEQLEERSARDHDDARPRWCRLRLQLPDAEMVAGEVTVRAVLLDAEGRSWPLARRLPISPTSETDGSKQLAGEHRAGWSSLAVAPSFDR